MITWMAVVAAWCAIGCVGTYMGNRALRIKYPGPRDPDEEFDMYFVGMFFGPFNLIGVLFLYY